jgi:protocatechuate 3,4-dioxygenase beta subunit
MPSRGVLLLWLFVTGVIFGQDRSKQLCIFEGTVRDSKTLLGISKASVRLESADGKSSNYAGSTDANGGFRFEAIAPGGYRITTTHRGYSEAKSVSLQAGRSSAVVTFAAGQKVSDAVIALDAESFITGRVVDADGDPVAGAVVNAVAEKWQRGVHKYEAVGWATCDDRGQYRLKVTAGTYRFSARSVSNNVAGKSRFTTDPGQPELKTAMAYYPNAPAIDAATPLRIRPGQQLDGIDLKLRTVTTYHVRGVVQPYAPAQTGFLYFWNRNGDRSSGSFSGGAIQKDGSFDADNVEPGSYWMELEPFAGFPTGRMAIEVIDRGVDGVKMASVQPFELKGRVRFEPDTGQPIPPGLQLEMLDWHLFRMKLDGTLSGDGVLAYRELRSGQWVLTLAPNGDAYIQSITCGQHDLIAGKMDLTNGPCGELNVVLSTGTGQVDGTLHWPEAAPGEPPPWMGGEVSAVMVSADGETGNTGARCAGIDANSQFQYRFVPPGRYLVFATVNCEEDLWQNRDFITQVAGSGLAVELQKQGSVHIEVPILSAEDVQRAIEQVRR